MAKMIKGANGKTYKKVAPATKRKRGVEVIASMISFVVSLVSLASGMGLAGVADAFGGRGAYTGTLMLGMILSVMAFVLVFFINKQHGLVSIAIIILGIILLFACGNFGIIGGILFTITGIIALIRK